MVCDWTKCKSCRAGLWQTIGVFALRDTQGEWVNGKTNPDVHLLRAEFGADAAAVTLSSPRDGRRETFRLPADLPRLSDWLSDYFGKRVMVVENTRGGFPDDTESPGPTILSRQTVEAVTRWFPSISPDEVRERFRANLEIEGDAAFCEDRLFAGLGQVVRFEIGSVPLDGVNPCQRCIVPTRHPRTAEMYHAFSKKLAQQRQQTLPAWANPERFTHFYRLAVNTRLSPLSSGGTIRVGDAIVITGVCAGLIRSSSLQGPARQRFILMGCARGDPKSAALRSR